ncbi:MAG: ribose 5-phosphate isomerase B [Deltaproteobacteria bacterium]|jgi:ribose 5-phosphate isomerase B|nr:ribose 5-phosphate isomerase B [Deltaproteobacteria bacterium]
MSETCLNTIYIGSDHAGFALKNNLAEYLKELGFTVQDCGAYTPERSDYPEAAHKVCAGVLEQGCRGVLVCGSGQGMCMAANRHKGIRAALCTHEFHARGSRAHNNANIICLGERITAPALARELLKLFLDTPFEGGRHQHRLELLEVVS